jgi:hypothetical protein
MPFLTLLDERAKIKGSRDPLGLQSIWTRLGRQVITNLTTVTTSVRGFTTLLMGLYFAEQAMDQQGVSEADFADKFLKFEQLAAYSRMAHDRNGVFVLGIQRVKKNLNEGKNKVQISARQEHQILSNQKTYGLWGLYTIAARNSGLLEPGQSRLSPAAANFVERQYISRLGPGRRGVLQFLMRDQSFEPRGRHSELAARLAAVMGPHLNATEVEFYSHHLLYGGEHGSLQHQLWEHIEGTKQLDAFSMYELRLVLEQLRSERAGRLYQRLVNIQQVEIVIAPLAVLFSYLLRQDHQKIADVASELNDTLGELNHLNPTAFGDALSTVEEINPEAHGRLCRSAEALKVGEYGEVLHLLLAQNKAVMQSRNSAPWLKLDNAQFDVRFRDDTELPLSREMLPELWLNTYFINSLKTIGLQLS